MRAEIHQIEAEQQQTSTKKSDAAVALRDQGIEGRCFGQGAAWPGSEARARNRASWISSWRDATRWTTNFKDQREALAALMRLGLCHGPRRGMKLLLASRIASTQSSAMLEHFRYFEHARVGEVQGLLKDLDALAQVQHAIETETAGWPRRVPSARPSQRNWMPIVRRTRRRALAALDATLKDEQGRLAALGKDEKGLLELLARLRDIFADIPKQIAGAEPFAQLRGRLIWPIRGRIVAGLRAGDDSDHESHGVLITASSGSEIHAVSHGRVVLPIGCAVLVCYLILDHGDGYLSLYGYNETLLKDVGDWINADEVIATSGDSGGRKTPGLYFELRYQGKAIDPKAWLKPSSR